MTTFVKASLNCGQVRGPVQIGFARSIDPIISQEISIHALLSRPRRMPSAKARNGLQHIIPYALYRAEGFVSANLARKSTTLQADLEL